MEVGPQRLNIQEEEGEGVGERDEVVVPRQQRQFCQNRNGLNTGAVAAAGWVLTAVFAILYGLEVAKSTAPWGGEVFPTPVIVKLTKKTYPENLNYERMIIQGFNDSDATMASKSSLAGILRWVNQQGFWYLEVYPVSSSEKDCFITNHTDLYGKLDSPTSLTPLNAINKSYCNLYDFRLVIFNDLDEGATVHFHGLTPPSNEDGVPFVSNANIHPKNIQRYRFNQNTYAGFYWMHSHTGFQQAFGVATPIVLHHSDTT